MADKTLFVSDLDGTLLRVDQTLSPFTVNTLNRLIEEGMLFSYATARSYHTASQVTNGLHANIPVIIYNGSFVVEQESKKRLLSNSFSKTEAKEILDLLLECGLSPLVYGFLDGVERYSFLPHRQSRGMKQFNDSRRGDVRENPVDTTEPLYRGEIFHFTCIDEEEILLPLYNRFKEKYCCIFHKDIYSGEQWLEIQPINATKAHAILKLKALLGCEKVVCFGDGRNDLSMFEIADACYAVGNADPTLKAIATGIIEGNEADGVAKWLAAHWKENE